MQPVSPPNTVCITALPCKILITTLPIRLYMFTTVNNNKYKNICTLDIVRVKKRHNTDYGTLLKFHPWSERICCCINARCCCELLEPKFTLVTYSAAIAMITRPQGRTRYLKISNIRPVRLKKIITQKLAIITTEVKTGLFATVNRI